METKVVTAHIPVQLVAKLDALGTRLDRSRGWIVRQALEAWIAQEDERSRITLDALMDVDAGNVIDHGTVQDWVDSINPEAPTYGSI